MTDWRSIVEAEEPVVVLRGRAASGPAAYERYVRRHPRPTRSERLRTVLERGSSLAFSLVMHLLVAAILIEALFIVVPETAETWVTVGLRPSTRSEPAEAPAPPAPRESPRPSPAEAVPAEVVGTGASGRAPQPVPAPAFETIEPIPAVETGGFPGGAFLGNRGAAGRKAAAGRYGGDAGSEAAVELGLRWLAAHQSADGRWSPATYAERCPERQACGKGFAREVMSTGVTATALLAFLGAGATHREGNHRETVDRGLRCLLERQESSGRFPGSSLYDHGVAALALAEALSLTGDERLRGPLEKATAFIERTQGETGGWAYAPGPGQPEFTLSVWQMMALKAAATAGVPVSDVGVARYRRYLNQATLPDGGVEYRTGRPTPGCTAAALFMRCLVADPGKDGAFEKGLQYLDRARITAESYKTQPSAGTLYAMYYRTLVMFQLQGEAWREWNRDVRTHLVSSQKKEGHGAGTWPSMDTAMGGRVCGTAMAVLMLEVYYRYLPMMTGRTELGAVAEAVGSERARELARQLETDPELLKRRDEAVAMLKSARPDHRFMGARRLAEMGDRTALPEMIAAAEREEGPLRPSHLRSIGRLKAKEAVPFLVGQLDHPEEPVRSAAMEALRATTGEFHADPAAWKRWHAGGGK